ncbi:tripartite tricarboxylate transporter TctB family protein [Shouchella shacheensis]|uniref:tripartite tricarboxylate transporter TctB family protein n=1 Tax=Shouchella shacheensis TaxID=1649580 RepID=UPI0007402B35|nr:tripartite tricarboxylate transporter TctB family protein [Shouchella shacheensis]
MMAHGKWELAHRLILPTLILCFSITYFIEVKALSSQDQLLINPIFWVVLFLYLLVIVQECKQWKQKNETLGDVSATTDINQEKMTLEDAEAITKSEGDARLTKKVFYYMVGIALYLVLVEPLGFVIVTLAFLSVMMRVLGTKSFKVLTTVPITVVLIIYFIFVEALGIPFPVWPS